MVEKKRRVDEIAMDRNMMALYYLLAICSIDGCLLSVVCR